MKYMICLLILLFGISFNNGHALTRTELNDDNDVYEVKEGETTLTITHPKDSKPTLREIVYFHVIERPYDNEQVNNTPNNTPNTLSNNKRSFTNGHGFQYVDDNNDVIDLDTDDKADQNDKPEIYEDDDENEIGAKTTESSNAEDLDDYEDDGNDDNGNGDNDGNDNDTNDIDNGTKNTDPINNDGHTSDKATGMDTNTEEPRDNTKEPETAIDSRFGEPDNSPNNSDVKAQPSRRKREISYQNIPSAPKLPEMNLDSLPDYIKAIIMPDQDIDKNESDEIENQVRRFEMAVNHPPAVERENEERDARTFNIDDRRGNTKDTYGMSLTGNNGKVWNNVNGHHSYHIDEPETTTVSKREPTIRAFVDDNTETHENINIINEPKDLNKFKGFRDSFDETKNILEELINKTDEEKAPVTSSEKEDTPEERSEERESVYNGPTDDKKEKRAVRTYGMSLAGESGVVWNDVNTHVSYHVGEPETIDTTPMQEDATTIPTTATETDNDNVGNTKEPRANDSDLKDIVDSLDEINNLLDELLNLTQQANTPNKTTNMTPIDQNDDSKNKDDLKDIEDSFDEVNRLFAELINNGTSETTTDNRKDVTTKEPDSKTIATTEEITESITTVATTTESTTISGVSDETNDKPTEKPNDNNDRKHNNGTQEESKQKQFVKELMKNKFFWQWLQDSSAAYLEVLMKKVDALIKAEVDKQIKQYFEDHKNSTNCKPEVGTQNNTTDKPIQNNNVTYEDVIVTTERPTANNTLEKPAETEVNETSTQNPTTEANDVNNNIDEKESKSNNTVEARRPNNDKDKPVKIEANNVYGNSVGNGKVTNIFIFNISKESDLKNMKPINNGTNGVFVFGIDDNDKNSTSNVTTKPEINKVTTEKPVTDPTNEKPEDNGTTEHAITEKQTTTTEPSTTASTNENKSTTTEKIVDSTTEKVIDTTTEKIVDTSTEKIVDTTTEKMVDSTTEKVIESTTENVIDSTTEKAVDTTTEKIDLTTEKLVDSTTEESTEAAKETITEKSNSTNETNTKQDKPKDSKGITVENIDDARPESNSNEDKNTQDPKESKEINATSTEKAQNDISKDIKNDGKTEKAGTQDKNDSESKEIKNSEVTDKDISAENEV